MANNVTADDTDNRLGPEVYARVFENHAEGRQVLEDLVKVFGRNVYVKGGLEGDRQTCFNAGSRQVLDYILGKISQAGEQ